MPVQLVFDVDDPRAEDVGRLLAAHHAFAAAVTPPEHVHALDVDGLLDPAVTFVSVRRDGVVVAVGALKRLDDDHAELKSMHVAEAARGQGIGAALLGHLLRVATQRGFRRVSLETGAMDAFSAARSMYLKAGFVPCEPFADYPHTPISVCMTRELG